MNAPTGSAADLDALRAEIESVDAAIVALVGRRQALAREIGEHKRRLGMPVLDPPREAAVVRRVAELARQNGVPEEAVRELFRRLMAVSRAAQVGSEEG